METHPLGLCLSSAAFLLQLAMGDTYPLEHPINVSHGDMCPLEYPSVSAMVSRVL